MNILLTQEHPSIKHLCNKDKRLAKVIYKIGNISYKTHSDPYIFLIHEIIEQMLSKKAGTKIFLRLLNLCNGEITPLTIKNLTDTDIKSIGTANSKVQYIRNITNATLNGSLNYEELESMTNDEVHKKLTSIKGIGKWTANMYLIFVLDRMDILPTNDAAFLQAYRWLYKTNDCSEIAIKNKCKKWKPYSSIAARYLYKALDNGLTKEEFHLYK